MIMKSAQAITSDDFNLWLCRHRIMAPKINWKKMLERYKLKWLPWRIHGQFYCFYMETHLTRQNKILIDLYKDSDNRNNHTNDKTKPKKVTSRKNYLPRWAIQRIPYCTCLTLTFNWNSHWTKNSAFPYYIPVIYCHINLRGQTENTSV